MNRTFGSGARFWMSAMSRIVISPRPRRWSVSSGASSPGWMMPAYIRVPSGDTSTLWTPSGAGAWPCGTRSVSEMVWMTFGFARSVTSIATTLGAGWLVSEVGSAVA
jgi:hypothetical protein